MGGKLSFPDKEKKKEKGEKGEKKDEPPRGSPATVAVVSGRSKRFFPRNRRGAVLVELYTGFALESVSVVAS